MPDDFEYEEKSYEEEDEDNEYPNDPKYYKNMIKDFEKTHFKILDPPTFCRVNNGIVKTYNEKQFRTQNIHIKCNIDIYDGRKGDMVMKKKNLVDVWINDYEDIRIYECLNSYPYPRICPDDEYNMWSPFRAEMIQDWENKEEELEIILNHIKILCGRDELVYEYFLEWLAHMVQRPGEKPGTSLTFISEEGAGKNTLLLLLKKMLSENKVACTSSPSQHVWGNFNASIMKDGFLICLNELSKSERLHAEGKIKELITDDTVIINQKNVAPFVMNSYHRFISFTNNEEPLTTKKDDRRNLVIRCSDELIGNNEYFTMIYGMIEDDNIIKTLYEYLKNMNIGNFLKKKKPITEYQADLQNLSTHPIESFLEQFTINHYDDLTVKISSSSLFNQFLTYIDNNRLRFEMSNKRFTMKLKNMKLDGIRYERTIRGSEYIIHIPSLITHFNIEKNISTDDGWSSDEEEF